MSNFSIAINGKVVTTISGVSAAWDAYFSAGVFCDAIGATCDLIDAETGEVIDSCGYDEEPEYINEDLEDFEEDLEEGFDPYEGCYTFDC